MMLIIKSISYGSVIKMTEKKFSIPLILLAAASFAIGFFGLAAEGILLGIIAIIIAVKMREKYLIKIPIAICIVSIVFSAVFLAFLIWTEFHGAYSSYWLMQLIFGTPE